ncbi:Translation factor GUF1-like protein, mitochondrial [Frankliniella fusca]|uniref:Translation factor GUF1-like protein, mitochondrial n=1 Tax=Frankliniella fusca TaxID=407009 RepID=A0AAE1LG97_9NEOP|nr:Translation factor GUF1-like protein, mitochondrial [Frankliniella fusca]
MYVGVYKVARPRVTDRCCNPLKNHRKGSEPNSNLYTISICGVLRAREKNIELKYGETYCPKCRLEIMELPTNKQQSQETGTPTMSQASSAGTSEAASPALRVIQLEDVKKALQSISVSPTSVAVVNLNTTRQALNEDEVLTESEGKAQHFYNLMIDVKNQLPNASKSQKYQLLSLYPQSMPIREGARFFNVSRTLLIAALKLRQEKGLLSSPSFQRISLVSDKTRSAVVKFYLDDRYSKVLPGRRDVISLGGGAYEQKRLLLCNLNELFALFKNEFSDHKIEDLMMKSKFSPKDLELFEDCILEKQRLLEEEVQYQQWKSTDRAEMISVISEYLKQLKNNLSDTTLIVTMDFEMNYSCLIQGEIQSYHWSKKHVTIHPVVIFYKENQEVKHRTIVFISDELDHDADLVQVFEDKIINIVKQDQDHASTTCIEYFTDGCGAQYKNKKTFMRDCQQMKKHGTSVKRNFHATRHGKCLCDAASASVKRKVANASLQRPLDNQIINAQDVYDFCNSSDLDEGEITCVIARTPRPVIIT